MSKDNPSNVVAKLMGLDNLPKGEADLLKGYSNDMYGHLEWPLKHLKMEDRFILHGVHHPNKEQIGYKDGYKMWREDVDETKMALVRQKFVEAKCLSTNETLRQSKQFEDALEFLSSNSDLLIRFLDTENPYQLRSTPPDNTKHITLIKPLKIFGNDKWSGNGKKNDRLVKKPTSSDQAMLWENMNYGYSSESTRIVVLKPSPGRTNELKALVSSTNPSPQSFYHANEDLLESIKVAKDITLQMHEGLKSYQKEKTLLHSSLFSNGYSSDLEDMSPMPRHSWDCINVCGNPYSTQSLGRASCSPESLVCIEAKKRLSERWNIITSKENGHLEQSCEMINSTLGEMLSLSLVKKKPVTSEVESTNIHREEPSKSVSCRQSFNKEMSIDDSPQNVYEPGKGHGSKVLEKSKSKKLSFKGKVASFLFSMSKRSTKKKTSSSQMKDETTATETSFPSVSLPRVLGDNVSRSFNIVGFEESLATSTNSVSSGQQKEMITLEPGMIESKHVGPGISNEKQDRPIPISVLESPFEDYNTAHESLECMKSGHMGSLVPLKSNFIDKSPPIESVARNLSSDEDSCGELVESPYYPLKTLSASSLDNKLEENEWLILVQKLLLASGLDDDNGQQQNYNSFHTRWHSLESPLDPSLRDTYPNKDSTTLPLNEAKRRKMRSNQNLVFDCVNAALLEVVGYNGSENYFNMYNGTHRRPLVQEGSCLMDHIVVQMKELIANRTRFVYGGDIHSPVVENVIRKEVGLVKVMRMEIDDLGREIEGKIIEELVENVVLDFIGR